MPIPSAERQRNPVISRDSFVKLFDRGLGRKMTEEALQGMISRTLGAKFLRS